MDPNRLRTFVVAEYPRVVAAVTLVCGDPAVAEDAVQEALTRACEQVDKGVHIRNLAAWVTTVASNHSRTGFRRQERERRALLRLRPEPEQSGGGPAGVADAVAVHRAIATLPRRQRHAVVLRYFLGLDVREVAAEMDIAEGTAKALLYQARHRLATELDESVDVPADHQPDGTARCGPTTSEVTP